MENILVTKQRSVTKPKPRNVNMPKLFLDRMSKNYLPFANEHAAVARKHTARLEWRGGEYLLQFGKKWTPHLAKDVAMRAVVRALLPRTNLEWMIAENWAALYQHAANANVSVEKFAKWCARQDPNESRQFVKRKVRARRVGRSPRASSILTEPRSGA